jgi:hypothetical protein
VHPDFVAFLEDAMNSANLGILLQKLQCSGATDGRSGAWAYETATALAANSRTTLFMLISSFHTEASGLGMCPL